MEFQSDISRTNSQVSETEFIPVNTDSILNLDVDLSRPKKKSTFYIDGNPIKILKCLNKMKDKNTFKLNPANILAERLQENLIRVYINFNPDERRFLHQIQNYFEGLTVTEVSNQNLKNFPKYATESMRLNPDKFKAFHGAAMGNFYNFLGMKIKGKMRSTTKSVEPKKEKIEEDEEIEKIEKKSKIENQEINPKENPTKMKKSRSWKDFKDSIVGYLFKNK